MQFFHLLVETVFDHEVSRDQPADLSHDRLSGPIDSEQPLIEEPVSHRPGDMINLFFLRNRISSAFLLQPKEIQGIICC